MKLSYKVEHYCNYQIHPEDTKQIKYAVEVMRDDLSQKGVQGWDLVSVVPHIGGEFIAVFKRPWQPVPKPKPAENAAQEPVLEPVVVQPEAPVAKLEPAGCSHGPPLPPGARCSMCEE